jgi:capsular polysaccharide biosynthesis protein
VNDPAPIVAPATGMADELPERLWAFDSPDDVTDSSVADVTGELVGLGFITAALRRRMRFLCAIAVIGLLIGLGLYVKLPPAFHASTTVFLVDNPNQSPSNESLNDVQLAQSTTVARNVVRQLGLTQSPASLLADYTVTPLTYQVLQITTSARTSSEAVKMAAAVGTQFLKFRAQYTQAQEDQTLSALDQQVSQGQQHLTSIDNEINRLSSQTGVPGQQAKLADLRTQKVAAANSLAEVQQYVTVTRASLSTATASMVNGSQVLDAAQPGKHSRVKTPLYYLGGGLLGGLAVGLAIVIIGAITSDRLRRRDDIANAFGTPVRLSVGPLRVSHWPSLGRRAKNRQRDMRRLVEHLRRAVPGGSRSPASLAIVAVDDARSAAEAVVLLAQEGATQGQQVVLADLSSGRYAARSLKVDGPGIHTAAVNDRHMTVVVPDPDDVAPVGPLRRRGYAVGHDRPDERLTAAATSADVLLALVTLDPAYGADHLATWVTDAVAVVTAGRSTATTIRAAGEMLRAAGTHLDSVVVIGADKTDESLGAYSAASQPAPLQMP